MDIWGIIFPRTCPICGKIIKENYTNIFSKKNVYICSTCKKELPYIKEPRCMKCGKEVKKTSDEYCYDCKNKKHIYDRGLALFKHIGDIKLSIYKIKYNNKREYVDFYVDEIVKRYGKEIKEWNAQLIIPVPLHKKKKVKRGYNQAEIIAKKLSKRLSIPYSTKVLKRVKNTMPQKELNDIQRKKNLEKAFKISENIVELKKVILVDDIYTTGSTIDECAVQLRKNGVEQIYFVCMSIGTGY